MDLDSLKNALNGNSLSYSKITASEIANIMPFANVSLNMDKTSFDYYYTIDVKELIGSEMPNDELETLKKQGWSFNEDNTKLVLFLKNS